PVRLSRGSIRRGNLRMSENEQIVEPQGAPDSPEPAEQHTEAPATSEGDAPAVASESGEDSPPRKPNGVQRRIGELTKRLREAEERNAQLAAQQAPQPAPEQTEQAPKPDDYDSYEDYLKAEARHTVREEMRQAETEREQREQERETQAQIDKVEAEWHTRTAAAVETYPDFEAVAMDPNLDISPAMADAIKLSENGADILYHLGKNPAEATSLYHLPPAQALLAIGRIGAGLGAPQQQARTQQRSTAPAPAEAGRTAAQTTNDLRDDLPMNEWLKRRRKQVYN
ncbi:MAG: hypothetical protein ACPGVG_19145, partial [Mycobacterium sp.]